jgi:hypothetical protein
MSGVSRWISLVALASFVVFGTVARAEAAGLLEKNFWLSGPRYDNVLPPCEAALGKIASGFAEKESRFWNSALRIVDFTGVRQIAFDPWVSGTIPRRFCRATALVSAGSRPVRHSVYYWIGEDTGFIGASWGVEWCVVGLDRNWAYNPACKMARP